MENDMKPNTGVKLDLNDEFIQQYTPLVKRIAYHLLGRLPSNVQVDDLIQSGMIGLLEAAKKFDPQKEVMFTTYAGIRIRGAMLDEVRKGDWAPRSVHRNSRMIAEAIRMIEHRLKREAKDTEVAEYLKISLTEYYHMLQDSNGTKILGFEDLGEHDEFLGSHQDKSQITIIDTLHKKALKEGLAHEIAKLPEKEKHVFFLYYDEELNLREIGVVLGVTESRVSQIHGQGMKKLRSRMAGWKEAV